MAECPDRETLHAYLAGRLDDEAMDSVAGHVDTCSECQAALSTLDEPLDALVSQLQESPTTDPFGQEPACQRALTQAIGLVTSPGPAQHAPDSPSISAVTAGQLGDYQIVAKLGDGGMGAVYKARHVRLD